MTIKYQSPKKPHQKGVAKLPKKLVARAIAGLTSRGFIIISVK